MRSKVERRPTRLVRNRNLVAYWRDGEFVVEDFERRRQITAAPLVALLLGAFEKPRSIPQVTRELARFEPRSVGKEIRVLFRLGFLVDARNRKKGRDLFRVWQDSFPAIYYQSTSRDAVYVTELPQKLDLVQSMLTESPQPATHKVYARSKQVALPNTGRNPTAPFGRVLAERRTVRHFAPKKVSLADFAAVIRGTWGQTGWIDAGPLGRLPVKTSPSAGSRHPIECYVLCWRVQDLASGLYHYRVQGDRLELLRAGDFRYEAVRMASGQDWIRDAAFLCVMTAVTGRVFWKYRLADAYRLFFLDAGHLAQTFSLLATALRLGPFTTAALQESRIERFCGLDGIEEFPVYLCGAGTLSERAPNPISELEPISNSRRP